MSFTLNQVVPWGRSFDEYVAMFALTDVDLGGLILGCGDGPASFNAVLTRRGGRVISVDPLYRFSQDDIRERIHQAYAEVMEQTRKNAHEFIWTSIGSVEELGPAREEFLSDYPLGVVEKRYVDGELPHLPFPDKSFDLAVCSYRAQKVKAVPIGMPHTYVARYSSDCQTPKAGWPCRSCKRRRPRWYRSERSAGSGHRRCRWPKWFRRSPALPSCG